LTGEPLRVLVYEHVSGGGYAGKSIPASVLCEGYAMLRGAVSDFKAAGHSVTTLLDSRVAAFNPVLAADNVIPISSCKDIELFLRAVAEEADATLVIAPESNGVLQTLLETVERTDTLSLNCKAAAIKKVADKTAFHDNMKALELRVPKTLTLNMYEPVDEITLILKEKFSLPLILKPADSTSCSGLSVIRNWAEVASAVKKIKVESLCERFVAQEFILGVAASVSLITANGKAVPASLNKQDIILEAPDSTSRYEGGMVPLDSALRTEAFAAAEEAVISFEGLLGYVGVDLILTENGPVVIEVNPRLTTSFVGLRRVANFNIAKALLDAAEKNQLPEHAQTKGYSAFSKVTVQNPTAENFQRASEMAEAVCPPFPLAKNSIAYAFLCCQGDTAEAASLKLSEAKERLRRINEGGKR
jgi:predicted ATP-grasp superfamily ATP-dependent carboligase